MKSLRFTLIAALLSFAMVAVAQEADAHHHADAHNADAHNANAQNANAQNAAASQHGAQPQPPSATQLSFKALKSLAGEWEGKLTTDMPEQMKQQLSAKGQSPDNTMHVSLRVTSRGNVLIHEMQEAGTPLDASKYDHPVTMMYLDQDKLNLVHYCDAGNRPHMVARSSDGKTFEFDFADLSGSNAHGHMAHAKFTIVDANHHIEEWTYMLPGDVPIHATFDLQRVAGSESASLVK